jgi:hypothetical protein
LIGLGFDDRPASVIARVLSTSSAMVTQKD